MSVHVFEDDCVVKSGYTSANHTVVPEALVHIKYGGESIDHAEGAIDVKSNYDDTQTADFGGKTVFEGLRRGWYYLYAESGGTKTGGTAFEIKNRIGEREVVICTGAYK